MKQFYLLIAHIILLLSIFACGQRDNSKILEQYKFDEGSIVSNVIDKNKLNSWIKEGTICYGILIVRDENKLPKRIKEIQAKVINIHPECIKMEVLEDVMINPLVSCNKVSLKKGECWDELDGELFKTREDAIHYIDLQYPGLRIKF